MEEKQENALKTLNRLYREFDGIYHDIALKCGLSDSAFLILYSIVELGDGCLQTEIAKYHFVSKQTIHTSAKNLEKKGYLSFQRGKGRDMLLYLTESGKELVQEKIMPVFELERNTFMEMTQKERDQLLFLMEKYLTIFQVKSTQIL